MILFLELMNIHAYTGTFLERSSGRIKFKILLQLKKTLTKKFVEVKFENHGLYIFGYTCQNLPDAFEHSIFIEP